MNSLNGQSQSSQKLSVLVGGVEKCVSANGVHVVTLTSTSGVVAADVGVTPTGELVSVDAQSALHEEDTERIIEIFNK